jgi:integrase
MMANGLLAPLPAVQMQSEPIRIKHLTAAYREHCRARYSKSTEEKIRCRQICDELDEHYGDLLAEEFGPRKLKEHRERWVASGKSRVYCNRLAQVVKRMFRWGVSEELVSESAWTRLRALDPLRYGQTTAPERDRVMPAKVEDVKKTVDFLSPIVRAMVRVQIATGMRPSEVCSMRPCDIDRSGETWIYRPASHKNKGKGKSRSVPILGDARDAVEDYINRPAEAYLFSPAEADAWIRAKQRSERKGRGSYKKKSDNPKRKPGVKYNAVSYYRAISRAAERASVPHWHPYQLRHLVATQVREAMGVEEAQALLGHSNLKMTEHYAQISERRAVEAAKHAPKL